MDAGDALDVLGLLRYGVPTSEKEALAAKGTLPGAPEDRSSELDAANRYASGFLFGKAHPTLAPIVMPLVNRVRTGWAGDAPELQSYANAGVNKGVMASESPSPQAASSSTITPPPLPAPTRYKIRNPKSGKVYAFSKPPSDADIDEAFGSEGAMQGMTPSPVPSAPESGMGAPPVAPPASYRAGEGDPSVHTGRFLRDAAPAIGGLAGSVLGPAGTALGAAGGEGIRQAAMQLESGRASGDVLPAMVKEGAIQGALHYGGGLIGKGLQAGGRRLAAMAVGSPASLRGQDAGRALVGEKLVALTKESLLPKIQAAKSTIRDQISNTLGAVQNKIDFSKPLADAVANGRNIADLAAKTGDIDLYQAVTLALGKSDKLTPFEANQARVAFGKLANYAGEKVSGGGAGASYLNKVLKGAASKLGPAVDAAVPGTQKMVSRLGDLILAEEGLKDTIMSGGKDRIPSWLWHRVLWAVGGGGALTHHPGAALGALGALGAEKALTSTGAKTAGGILLNGLGAPPVARAVNAVSAVARKQNEEEEPQ